MELRKRRGLMIALILVTIGIPTVFLVIRLLLHAFAPQSYGPAGGYDIFTGLVAGVLYVFGFIVAATLGCHGGIRRPHRGDVPAPGGDRPLPPGAVPGPDPRRTGHHRAAGGGRLHHRLRGVRVRRADPAQLQRRERARRTCRAPASRAGPRTTPTRSSATSTSRSDRTLRSARWSTASPAATAPAAARARSSSLPGPSSRLTATLPGPDQAAGRPDRPDQDYPDYTQTVPVPVGLADDQERVVARTRSGHRVHRRVSGSDRCSGSGRSR